MKAIGFKNFRKFEDFPIMEMGDITMFVGGNNSGKSTTVKAIISILTFLRNARFYASGNSKHVLDNNFYFNENPYAHIGTFKRAKCNKNDLNELSFEIQIEDYLFSVFLDGSGCDENTAFAKIQRIILKDLSSNFIFNINYKGDEITMIFNKNTELFEHNPQYIADVQKFKEEMSMQEKDSRIRRRYEQDLFYKYPVVEEEFQCSAKITEVFNKRRMIGGPLISGILYNASYYFSEKEDNEENIQGKNFNKYDFLRTYLFRMSNMLDNILWNQPLVEYIYAHAASQVLLYNSTDNNYLSKTIHEFADFRDGKDTNAFDFVRKWMVFFEIGRDFKLNSIGGEAHTFNIVEFDDRISPLADKGMGTIQLMILLLRIAIIVNSRRFSSRIPVTVIVEEPEQNLHPKKQSQLIEFFYQVFIDYNIKFIIETHSEYLIRRSQVMVAEKKYETEEQLHSECPFKVYFYPENGLPYDMGYQINGRFAQDFESGFFDEASRYALQLSKIERGRV